MARRRINVQRLMLVLGVAVLALGAIGLWVVLRDGGSHFRPEPVGERVQRQAVEQLGPGAEVREIVAGRGPVVCGYVSAQRAGAPVAYVSRPTRLLLSTDPLSKEFRRMMASDCPAFPAGPTMEAVP